MALSTTYFDPVPIIPQIPKFCITNSSFSSKHTFTVIIAAHCAKFFYTTWVRGVAYQKQLSEPKLIGSGLGELVKMDPLFISATDKANNFKFGIGLQLGLGE